MHASWVEAALIGGGAVVGWYATHRWRVSGAPAPRGPSSDYLEGLNYLVNEQPDRAVEAFLRAVAVDRDTVETQFALGALFRRRGEVDRAIRVHQNLIARETLEPDAQIVPLLACDGEGWRLGYGGGFYDRLLARTPRPLTLGVAYDCVEARFDGEAHDIALDAIVTESRLLD